MIGWDVYLCFKWIDKVFFNEAVTAEQVRTSLINLDGYDSRIIVKAENK